MRAVRRRLVTALLTVVSGLAATEAGLRLAGYCYAPTALLPPPTPKDSRGLDARGMAHIEYDPELLWRPDRKGLAWVNDQGFRGALVSADRDPSVTLVVALGDSNTAGALQEGDDHWPGELERLVAINALPGRRVAVVNAGVYGYSSFQGLRQLPRILSYRPDLVYFSFGAGDAQLAPLSDAGYARRLAWLGRFGWLRLGPPLAHSWRSLWEREGRGSPTRRVPLADHQRNLEQFVARARAARVTPVLLTRPYVAGRDPETTASIAQYNDGVRQVALAQKALLVEVANDFAGRSELFGDDLHFNRLGNRRMAERLLGSLKSLGLVASERQFASGLSPGAAPTAPHELRSGFWAPEVWPEGAGRWTAAEAQVVLGRSGAEGGLLLVGRLFNPTGQTRYRVEAGGLVLGRFESPDGPFRHALDIRQLPGRDVSFKIVTENATKPPRDSRVVGVFLMRAELVPSPYSAEVRPGELPDSAPELARGFGPSMPWSNGKRGRWTRGSSILRLGRNGNESRLILELAGESPAGYTNLNVQVNGRPVRTLRVDNQEASYSVDLPSGEVDLEVELRAAPPTSALDSSSSAAGVFLLGARLTGEDEP